MPKFFDIHSHVHFEAFKDDASKVVQHALDEGVWMIQVGTQRDTSKAAIALANSFPKGVYASVGLHPIHTQVSYHDKKELGEGGKAFSSRGEVFDYALYKELALDPKVVAIGECGLDYYRLEEDTKEEQKKAFEAQINLANEIGKPLMLHIRNAYKDAYEILKSTSKVKGNVHFFAGTWSQAKWFLDFGFSLSFTGVITFARDYDEVVLNTPLSMILSETDSPYVTPVPHRGSRNEPLFVKEVAHTIATIRGEGKELVEAALVENAIRVFGIEAS